jgi:hypothetical protein
VNGLPHVCSRPFARNHLQVRAATWPTRDDFHAWARGNICPVRAATNVVIASISENLQRHDGQVRGLPEWVVIATNDDGFGGLTDAQSTRLYGGEARLVDRIADSN